MTTNTTQTNEYEDDMSPMDYVRIRRLAQKQTSATFDQINAMIKEALASGITKDTLYTNEYWDNQKF
jgi:hypothetical protein